MFELLMQNYSDEQLIVLYLGGDEQSLDFIVRRYLKPIYNFIYRYAGNRQDAEDIAQDVFLRAWKSLKKFDRSKKFKTWIFSIARNAAIDWLRKKKNLTFSDFEDADGENPLISNLTDSAPLPDEIIAEIDCATLTPFI